MTRLGTFLLLGVAACSPAAPRTIPRIVDGRIERGPVVSPYAYEWFIEGEVSAAKGEHEQAAIAFENATAAPAADVLLMARLAEEYEKSGAGRRADRALALARRAYPESARVALAEARILQSRGDDEGAISSLMRARRLAPSWDEPVIATAEALRTRGQLRRAYAILFEHIAMVPEERALGPRHLLIDMARRAGDAETLNRALALDPSVGADARARAAGLLALDMGRPALAARIMARDPGPSQNTDLWLRALRESGARDQAAAFVASSEGKRWGGALERARLLMASGETGRALVLLRMATPSPSARYTRGVALVARGNYLDAAAVLADVPFGAASFEAARLALADCASSQQRPGAAAQSLAGVPHDSLALRAKLAETYLSAGDLRSGLRLFDPKLSSERAVLASLFEQAGRFEEAPAFYATVQVSASDTPRLRARATSEQLASRGLLSSAIVTLEDWSAFAPEDLYARVRLVELLQNDGRIEAARTEGRRILPLITDPLLRGHLTDLLQDMPAESRSETVPAPAGASAPAAAPE